MRGAVPADDDFTAEAASRIDAVIAERGWAISEGTPARRAAVDVLAAMIRLDGLRLAVKLPTYAMRTPAPEPAAAG